jgi:hypothetical protein
MKIELYQEVALTRDLPEYGLRAGDVNEPGIDRHQGGVTADDLARLDRLVRESVTKTGEVS